MKEVNDKINWLKKRQKNLSGSNFNSLNFYFKLTKLLQIFICMSVVFCATCQVQASEMRLPANCRIVVAENQTSAEDFAAKELSSYMKKVTGKDAVIVSESKHDGSPAIYVGQTKYAEKNGMTGYKPEEYHIKVFGENVVITGGRPRGVLFGAYEFLERVAGIRFLSINFKHVPEMAELTLPDNMDLRHSPAFKMRFIYPGETAISGVFMRQLRQNGSADDSILGFYEREGSPARWHALRFYSSDFPKEISWMNSDKVREKADIGGVRGSICFSHPEVLKRISAKLRGFIEKDRAKCAKDGTPYPVFYSVDGNDCPIECFCPECQKFIKANGVSGLVVDFMNRLWDTVKTDYPDIRLAMFAYMDALEPPKSDIKAADGVLVRIAYYGSGGVKRDPIRLLSAPANKPYVENLDAWKKCAKTIGIWDYWRFYSNTGDSTPANNVAAIPELIRKYKDIGVVFIFVEWELLPECPLAFFDLRFYLGSKMLNDPSLDEKVLISEFMNIFYGKGAPQMKEYLAYSQKRMIEGPDTPGRVVIENCKFFDKDYFSTLYSLLEQAKKNAAGNAAAIANITQEQFILDITYLRLWNNLGNPMGFNVKELVARIKNEADAYENKYFPQLCSKARTETIKTFTTVIDFAPRQEVELKPLDKISFLGKRIVRIEGDELNGGVKVEDADAKGGTAKALLDQKVKDFYSPGLAFGIHEFKHAKYLIVGGITKADVPRDEKFHWYYAGRTRIYSDETRLWLHWSWTLSFSLKKALTADFLNQYYDVYVSLKLQGPSYVAGSKKPDSVRVDQIVLVNSSK